MDAQLDVSREGYRGRYPAMRWLRRIRAPHAHMSRRRAMDADSLLEPSSAAFRQTHAQYEIPDRRDGGAPRPRAVNSFFTSPPPESTVPDSDMVCPCPVPEFPRRHRAPVLEFTYRERHSKARRIEDRSMTTASLVRLGNEPVSPAGFLKIPDLGRISGAEAGLGPARARETPTDSWPPSSARAPLWPDARRST